MHEEYNRTKTVSRPDDVGAGKCSVGYPRRSATPPTLLFLLSVNNKLFGTVFKKKLHKSSLDSLQDKSLANVT